MPYRYAGRIKDLRLNPQDITKRHQEQKMTRY